MADTRAEKIHRLSQIRRLSQNGVKTPTTPPPADPLGALRRKLSVKAASNYPNSKISKLKMVAHLSIMSSRIANTTSSDEIQANQDKHSGRPGLYKSCRPVHAFDTDATLSVTSSWGSETCHPGDFIVVGEPKATTHWRNDIYTAPRGEFLADFQPIPGVFHEYKRSHTMYAWGTVPAVADGTAPPPNAGTDWTPGHEWHVFTAATGEYLRKVTIHISAATHMSFWT